MSRDSASPSRAAKGVRVLVVDDSAFMRYLISKQLSADSAIEVAGTASDGVDALRKITTLRPDVVTLDLEMPRMDGLTALGRIMAEQPLPVILLSTLTHEGAAVTIRGLEMGAVDFVTKPAAVNVTAADSTWQQLASKVRAAADLKMRRVGLTIQARGPLVSVGGRVAAHAVSRPRRSPRIVVIGTSTGGPRALFEVVQHLPADLRAAVLIVQHMPAGFTKSLAGRLNDVSPLDVREAAEGDSVETGTVLLAPGDFHMVVRAGGRITLEKTPPIHGVRPAVDITMQSVAAVYGASTVGVVLTGMGTDGTQGAIAIRRAGGLVLSEDEATCVVYGMPRSVREAGASDRAVRLEAVAEAIVEAVSASEGEMGVTAR